MKQQQSAHRRTRFRQTWIRAFTWVLIAIFVAGSVGVSLLAFGVGR